MAFERFSPDLHSFVILWHVDFDILNLLSCFPLYRYSGWTFNGLFHRFTGLLKAQLTLSIINSRVSSCVLMCCVLWVLLVYGEYAGESINIMECIVQRVLNRHLTGSHHSFVTVTPTCEDAVTISSDFTCNVPTVSNVRGWRCGDLGCFRVVPSQSNEHQLWFWRCMPRRPINTSGIQQCRPRLLAAPRGAGTLKGTNSFSEIEGAGSSLKSGLPRSSACLQAYGAEMGAEGRKSTAGCSFLMREN